MVTSKPKKETTAQILSRVEANSLVQNKMLEGISGSLQEILVTLKKNPVPIPPVSEFGILYNDTHSQLHQWLEQNPNHEKHKLLKEEIADIPKAIWVSSNWNTNVTQIVREAREKNQVPVFVMYNAIKRDLGGQSAGGAKNLDEYIDYCRGFADITRGYKCIVILEPDALPHISSMNGEEKLLRQKMFDKAIEILKEHDVYIDAGHPEWLSVQDAATLLKEMGVSMTKGFSLNVSNRIATTKCKEYGVQISKLIGRPFVIDTSRNGIPHAGGDWCNPSPEGCGAKPTFETDEPLCKAFMWLKSPGESDGNCNGGPAAGTLWIERAIQLAENSKS